MKNSIYKRKLTLEIKQLKEYLADVEDQIKNQYPQPDGRIYLHGDVIARKMKSGKVFKSTHVLMTERELADLISLRALA